MVLTREERKAKTQRLLGVFIAVGEELLLTEGAVLHPERRARIKQALAWAVTAFSQLCAGREIDPMTEHRLYQMLPVLMEDSMAEMPKVLVQ